MRPGSLNVDSWTLRTRPCWALAVTLLTGLAGCSTPGDSAPVEPSESGVVASVGEPSSMVLAEAISVAVASRSEFVPWPAEGQPTAGDSDTVMVVTRERQDPEIDATPHEAAMAGLAPRAWIVRRFLKNQANPEGSGGKLLREMRLVRTEAGGLAISEEVNHTEGVRVEFTPPMYVLPAELPIGGEQCVYEDIHMVVRPIDQPDRVKAQGTVRHVVCYEADETLRTPAGEYKAHRVMSRFEADLGASKIENVSDQWYVPGIGLVAERRHEQTRALGLLIRNNRDAWVLSSPGKPAETP